MSGAIAWWVSRKGGDPRDIRKILILLFCIVILAVVAKLLGADF